MDGTVATLLGGALPRVGATAESGLAMAVFRQPFLSGRHSYFFESRTLRGFTVEQVLPAGGKVLRTLVGPTDREVVVTVGDVALLFRIWDGAGDFFLSARDEAAGRDVQEHILARVPKPRQRSGFEMSFWSARQGGGTRRTRRIDAPAWSRVRESYPAAARTSLDTLARLRPPRPEGGRLLLWHGPPGTGKTTAARAMLRSWRRWAQAHYVTDPEQLFASPAYLEQVLFDRDEEDGSRWRVVVVEDAEEFLRRDARAHTGQALGRLLNISDGMLGQGSEVLILLTSNEELVDLQPALLRPGRCLARVEFGRLSLSESATVAGRPVTRQLTLAEALEARGTLARVDSPAVRQPVAVGQYL